MSEKVIDVNDISKRYRLGIMETADTFAEQLKNMMLYPVRNLQRISKLKSFQKGEEDESVFWALKDINFSVNNGEILGIVGHNGAGKSTLLKILSRITEPTTGEIQIRGRVSSLLEVGTGFHDELTGRDNVFMNGTVLGMTGREIRAKFDEIVDFAGVEKYIDTPVKFYSSGMKVRLAFAVAAHLDPEILIIDEVLAVGDLSFQQKCLGKMDDVSKSGRTLLFVSHNTSAVEGLCNRCLVLSEGKIIFNGEVETAIETYKQYMLKSIERSLLSERTDREGEGLFKFTKVIFNNGKNALINKPLKIDLHYVAKKPLEGLQIAVKICRNYREIIMTLESKAQGATLNIPEGEGKVTIEVPQLPLMQGRYLVDLWAGLSNGVQDKIFNAEKLDILERDLYESGNVLNPSKHGLIIPPKSEWSVQ